LKGLYLQRKILYLQRKILYSSPYCSLNRDLECNSILSMGFVIPYNLHNKSTEKKMIFFSKYVLETIGYFTIVLVIKKGISLMIQILQQ
jgi:hypothetical protein